MKRSLTLISILLFFILFTEEAKALQKYDLSLKKGKNLISIPLNPQDTDITNLLLPIQGKYNDAWQYTSQDTNDPWKHYHPSYPRFSDLLTITHNKGYWIEATEGCILSVTGTKVTTNEIISFKKGWNLIGWPYIYLEPITKTLSSLVIDADYDQVTRFNAITQRQENFYGAGELNDFKTFESGYGYYIYCLKDTQVTLIYDITPPAQPTIDPVTTPTNKAAQTLTGTKEAYSGIWVNAAEKIALNSTTTWSIDVTLSEGENSFNITAKDSALNESQVVVVEIFLDTTPPAAPVVTDDGVYTTKTTELHAKWVSDDPETGISEHQYAIGTAPSAIDVVGWTPIGTKTEVTHTGLTLIQGQSYYISVKAKNRAGSWSNVGTSDGIKVNQTIPKIIDIQPPDKSTGYKGADIVFTVRANDSDGDTLSYQFTLNGNIIQPWQSSPEFTWVTTGVNLGIHTMKVEVTDGNGGLVSQNVELCLFREPIAPPL